MATKVTVVGAGNVGATAANVMAIRKVASEVCLIDIKPDLSEGKVLDMYQTSTLLDFDTKLVGVTNDYKATAKSDVVVITSGVPRKPGMTREELIGVNAGIVKSVVSSIIEHSPNAILVIVSNPMDIMTYAFTKYSGLPESQIIGSGTLLDTARLRYALSEHYGVSQRSIHAYVFGEHGDTSFVPWSRAFVSCVHIDEYHRLMAQKVKNLKPLDKDYMLEYVRNSGAKIIKNKGATFYAIAQTVAQLCGILLASCDSIQMVSSMMHGEYGIEDVCLSTLTLVGPQGIHGKVPMDLTYEEIRMLNASAESLKAVISKLEF